MQVIRVLPISFKSEYGVLHVHHEYVALIRDSITVGGVEVSVVIMPHSK